MELQLIAITSLVTFITGLLFGRLFFSTKQVSETDPKQVGEEKAETKPATPSPKDLQALIAGRRSIFPKDYNGKEVPDDVINALFEAANWAPTHGKTEPWRFVVVPKEVIPRINAIKKSVFQRTMKGPKLEKVLAKLARKSKDAKNISHMIIICAKKVARLNGNYMPEWEEIAAVSCAVQNMHLMLSAHAPYCGYWSSGGVGGWLESKEMRALTGMTDEGTKDPECDSSGGEGRADRILGIFHLGVCDKIDAYKARRKPVSKKVKWLNNDSANTSTTTSSVSDLIEQKAM